jgi:hypothetical protein
MRIRREEVAGERDYLRTVLQRGNARARQIASETLARVHELMHTTY